jgi:hypothetical protein
MIYLKALSVWGSTCFTVSVVLLVMNLFKFYFIYYYFVGVFLILFYGFFEVKRRDFVRKENDKYIQQPEVIACQGGGETAGR